MASVFGWGHVVLREATPKRETIEIRGESFARNLAAGTAAIHGKPARAVRGVSRDLALFLRGPYHAGPVFRDAARLIPRYGPVAVHAENVETTTYTHMDASQRSHILQHIYS
jgi:hypothetical protein